MNRYLDRNNNRLIYAGSAADKDFWDRHWDAAEFASLLKVDGNRFITKNTGKYLPPGSRILEGGCGRGDKVYVLSKNGYDAYGIDYAARTVAIINSLAPELKVSCQDVTRLDFQNSFFDGYWSLGVIEHFYDGYDLIVREMARVIKKGGYLFLTVPSMSPVRKIKAFAGGYPDYVESEMLRREFYQFALNEDDVIRKISEAGFSLMEKSRFDGVKGLKDEISIFKGQLNRFYNSQDTRARIMRSLLDRLVTWFTGHMSFMVFKRI